MWHDTRLFSMGTANSLLQRQRQKERAYSPKPCNYNYETIIIYNIGGWPQSYIPINSGQPSLQTQQQRYSIFKKAKFRRYGIFPKRLLFIGAPCSY